MHAIEVAFESIYMSGPEPTERSQPGIHLLKRLRFQPVETALGVHGGFHEAGVAQHAQVLGHGRLGHTQLTLDLSHRLLRGDQEAQYGAAVWLRDDFEHRFHPLDILQGAYTCQGIFCPGRQATVAAGEQERVADSVPGFATVNTSAMSFRTTNGLARIVGLSLVLASAVAFSWWAMRQPKLDRRVYRIGYEIEPPLHFQTKDGQPTGFAVDLINEAAARRGIRLQWLLEPESSEAALRAGKVDLWPMMTISPEREGVVYITDPFREGQVCFIVRMESPYIRLDDFRDATIAYGGHPFDLKLLRSRLPKAQFTVIESARQSMETVCQQRSDAAYLSEFTTVETLLNGIVCGGKGLRVIRIPELPILMEGIGATFEARPAADALRAEIGAMAEDGTFSRVASRWRSFSGRNLEATDALIRVKRRERWLIAGISGAVLLLFLMSWQAVRIRRERNRAEHATEQLHELAASLQDVRDEERTRIARELHDELGQALAAIKMDIGWAAGRVPSEDKTLVDRFRSTLALVDTTIRSMRKVATELRPSILDLGLNAAIEWMLEEFHARTGVEYSLDLPDPEVGADPRRATAIFRIFQEALTNVARHSRATCIDVRLERSNGDVILEVRDNGRGLTPQLPPGRGGSLGILGMRERALALGGEVTVESPASGGTVVRARIPHAAHAPSVPALGGSS